MKRPALPWDARFARRHPALETLFADLPLLEVSRWPAVPALDALLARAGGRPLTASGAPVHAVDGIALGGTEWERRIGATGAVPVRPGSWHDLFNVLSWRAFPLTKAALNAAHLAAMEGEPAGVRGRRRDALAGFDEDGLVVACEDPALAMLVRGFRWRELFVERRDEAATRMHAFAFGHALCEKLLAPFKGITGKALFVDVPPGFGSWPPERRLATADGLAAPLLAGLADPRSLSPLPVLGLPGWWPLNEDPGFYDDAAVFRPGRRGTGQPVSDR